MPKQRRNNRGNILVLILVITCVIVAPLLVFMSQTGLYVMDRDRVQATVDAASLVAANDLSRIIINDPAFGWVSLSNYPPIGKATIAGDGEPLPVLGINTLVGTLRQNTIVASALGNARMKQLAESDRKALDATIEDLNKMMRLSLKEHDSEKWLDIQGEQVQPYKHVSEFLRSHLPANVRLVSLRLDNGWLKGGGITTIEVPQPEQFAQVRNDQQRAGFYKAFVEVPADNQHFTFAGLGESSRLVSHSEYQPADDKHINTVVRMECIVERQNPYLPFLPIGNDSTSRMKIVAYAQPHTMADLGPKGLMTLRFSGQPVPGLLSWRDFLNEANFKDQQVINFDVIGGDYGLDKGASVQQTEADGGTADLFAEHLYYWLRNGHLKPKLGAVLDMINAPFKTDPSGIYAYEFAKDGTISHRKLEKDPFPPGVTCDAQSSSMVDTRIQGGLSPIIIFRDNVKNLGTDNGGKHGGQPLAGYPLNWCELPEYGGDENSALGLGKGRLGTQLTLSNPSAPAPELPGELFSDMFRRLDGKPLELQPRRNFYSGGLALDIEIGGIRQFQPAHLDIPSKRKFWASRKI